MHTCRVDDCHILSLIVFYCLYTEAGISVLELGCGAADPTRCLAENFPKSTFLASDISASNLEKGRSNCKSEF